MSSTKTAPEVLRELDMEQLLTERIRQDQLEGRIAALEQGMREGGVASLPINAAHAEEHID